MCHHFIIFSSFCPLFVFFYCFVLFSPCHIFLKYLDPYAKICHVFILSTFFIFLSFSSFSSLFHLFVMFLHILWILTNLSFKLYDLHQNMCGMFRCYTQIMYQFHDIYASDHLVKLSKCPFKFEVNRNRGKGVMHSNVYNNFLKIKSLLLFHETLCYLIDSLNLMI